MNNTKTIESKIYEAKIKEGVVVLELNKKEVETVKRLLEVGKIRKNEVNSNRAIQTVLKGNKLGIEVVDVTDFREELFKRAESFIKKEEKKKKKTFLNSLKM